MAGEVGTDFNCLPHNGLLPARLTEELLRAIEALGTIEPTGPLDRITAVLLQAAYEGLPAGGLASGPWASVHSQALSGEVLRCLLLQRSTQSYRDY